MLALGRARRTVCSGLVLIYRARLRLIGVIKGIKEGIGLKYMLSAFSRSVVACRVLFSRIELINSLASSSDPMVTEVSREQL